MRGESLRLRAERVGLVAAMSVVTMNVWLGAPLAGLLVGSRVAPSSGISFFAVATVAVVMLAVALALLQLLALLNRRHEELSGRGQTVRRHVPWLRSMRGERPHGPDSLTSGLSVLDRILVVVVMMAIAAFEIWFFFFSASPFDQRTGRDG